MTIIQIETLENGAHRNQTTDIPLSAIPDGWAVIPDDMEIPDTFPFIDVIVKGQTVISISPGIVPDIPIPEEPTSPSLNEELSTQIQALSRQNDFYEECIVELATKIYE